LKQAVIVCGGKGLRLSSVTKGLPKTLISLDGDTLLSHQLRELERCNVREVILCVGYGAAAIRAFCSSCEHMGVRISYSEEDVPLGTAGAVRAIRDTLDPQFYVVYGDLVFCVDLERFARHHITGGALATLLLHPSDHPYDSDLVELDNEARISGFLGKPSCGRSFVNLTNAAIYALDRRIVDHIPESRPVDFGADLFPSLLKQGHCLRGFVTNEYCKDIGQADRYHQALSDIQAGLVHNHA